VGLTETASNRLPAIPASLKPSPAPLPRSSPLIYEDMLKIEIDFFEACAKGVMCPIGTGAIDYPGINKALRELGYIGWAPLSKNATRETLTPVCATSPGASSI